MAIPNEFLAALLGAIAGGGASLGGSIVVSRHEVKRQARLRLHDQLLPELEASIDRFKPMRLMGFIDRGDQTYAEPPPVFSEVLAATRRAAAIAGRGSMDFVDRIEQADAVYRLAEKSERDASQHRSDEGGHEREADATAHRETIRGELVDEIHAFARWVERKIL